MPRPKVANIQAIAEQANVSIATVSRVINQRDGVSDDLRRRVQDVLAVRGFRPRVIANRPTNLGIVLDMDQPVLEAFTCSVLSGVAAYAFDQGLDTSIIFLRRDLPRSQTLVDILRARRCDASVLVFSPGVMNELPRFASAKLPCVLIAQQCDIEGVGYVDVDPMHGAQALMEHLLVLGHRRIGFLAGPLENNFDHQQRLAGYESAMRGAGHAVEPRWIVRHQPTTVTQEAGFRQAHALLDADPTVTAMFATNDEMAQGAIAACAERGLRVPVDVSVVGFDDYPGSAYLNPPLTTVRQPLAQMGSEAARAADKLARGVTDRPYRHVMKGSLVVRQSTAPPRSAGG